MATFTVPSGVSSNATVIDTFLGCDFTNSTADMDISKSPNCENMIRDVPGKIRKRMGYSLYNSYEDRINGYISIPSKGTSITHAGSKLYSADGRSMFYFPEYRVGIEGQIVCADLSADYLENAKWDKAPNKFVMCGANGGSYSSGSDFTGLTALKGMMSVTYALGRFIAVGKQGKSYYSEDGINWKSMEGLEDYDKAQYNDVYCNEDLGVVICCGTKGSRAYTIDCVNWNAILIRNTDTSFSDLSFLCSIVADGVYFFARNKIIKFCYNEEEFFTSGIISFSEFETIDMSGTMHSVCYDSDKKLYFMVGEGGKSYKTADLSDYTQYVALKGLANVTFHKCKYLNGKVCCVGNEGRVYCYDYEQDKWVAQKSASGNLSDITYDGYKYWVSSSNENVYYSDDLSVKWKSKKSKYSNMRSICYSGDEENRIVTFEVTYEDGTKETGISHEDKSVTSCVRMKYLTYGKPAIRCVKVNNNVIADSVWIDDDMGDVFTYPVSEMYDGIADKKSMFLPMGNKVYIADGEALLQYDGSSVQKVESIAYIPTLTISKDPSGGGTDFEPVNLLQPAFIETFYVDADHASTKAFVMSFAELDETDVKAWVMNANGDWVEKFETTDFTVDRVDGKITFTTAPGKSPVSGEDNVKIQAYKTFEGYKDRINKCTVGCTFGVNGNQDRLFLSGNPDSDFLNYDWYSEQYDGTYFGDTWYSTLGSSGSAVKGYAIINNYIAAFKDQHEGQQTVIIREGNLVDSKPAFPLINTLQGPGVMSKWSFAYMETEPLFLSKDGVMAVTEQDITGEKYSQVRSFFLNGKLLKENQSDLEEAQACVFNNFYCLAVGGHLYLLDGLQPIQTDKSLPYANRQYAGFYCTNIPARCIWTKDNKLYFGTETGEVYEFYTDKDDLSSYNDDGEAIECVWESADLTGKYFFNEKNFKKVITKLGTAVATSVNLYMMKDGLFDLIKSDSVSGRYVNFGEVDFSKFSFQTDMTQKTIPMKIRVKKVDKTRVRLTNENLNEPFAIYALALQYTEGNTVK